MVGRVVLSHSSLGSNPSAAAKALWPRGPRQVSAKHFNRQFESDKRLHTTIVQRIGQGSSKPLIRVRFPVVVPNSLSFNGQDRAVLTP